MTQREHTFSPRRRHLGAILAIFGACSPAPEHHGSRSAPRQPVNVPAEIAELAADALRAASEVKVRGDTEAVLREHPLSARYDGAMRKHLELMRELHRVGLQSHVRYPRYEVSVRHDQFCEDGAVAHLVVTARVRYDMESVPSATGSPPYTASQEEHVFGFARNAAGSWSMTNHHEINLAEMHRPDVVRRLRNPCGVAQ